MTEDVPIMTHMPAPDVFDRAIAAAALPHAGAPIGVAIASALARPPFSGTARANASDPGIWLIPATSPVIPAGPCPQRRQHPVTMVNARYTLRAIQPAAQPRNTDSATATSP